MSGAHTGDSLQQLDWLTHCELFPTLQQGYILKACKCSAVEEVKRQNVKITVESRPPPPPYAVAVKEEDFPLSSLARLGRATEQAQLCKAGTDIHSEPCQRFFKDGLATSFIRILTDEAVTTWKPDIQRDIYNNCCLLVELCVAKLSQDWFSLLERLALALNPLSKWHSFNNLQAPEKFVEESAIRYAQPIEREKCPKGWLQDLINLFGNLGGFKILHDRIVGGENLTVPVIAALIKPVGLCAEYLTDQVFKDYLVPVVEKVINFLDNLSDEALKKEATTEAKSDTFSSIMKSLRHLCQRVSTREDIETFRLKMILRLLQVASFSGKMNALNEINKIVPSVSYHSTYKSPDDEQLQAEKLAAWIKDNNVLAVVFRDNLHQRQYVEKLDKLVRFCIKEKVLTLEDLDRIWAAQDGKHDMIVKNVHDMLVKLAWDFSPEQLDHLFGCFQRSWVGATKKQRDELLDFIRHLAEDDKEGVMAVKVLDLLWNLAHRDDCPPDTMEHALNAHIKILDYSCSQERESQKLHWLQKSVQELSNEKWVIPALKQMKEICLLYLECQGNSVHNRTNQFCYRNDIISHLDKNYHLLIQICQNLQHYMIKVHEIVAKTPTLDPETWCYDGRYSHTTQVQSRLDFIRFALRDGQLWLAHQHALMVWESLQEKPAFDVDREACLKWFAKLVSDEPDIEPETARKIFIENVHQIPPHLLTDSGFRCFDRFFRMVNMNERRLVSWKKGFTTDNTDLLGLDYLWKAVLLSPESIVSKPIELLKDVYTNLSPKLQQEQIHQEFIQDCLNRLELILSGLKQYKAGETENEPSSNRQSFDTEVTKMVRCLTLLKEYVIETDEEYGEERGIPPHGKASWGRPFMVVIRYIGNNSGNPPEDFELWSHTNETVASFRRHILQRIKLSNSSRLELSVGNDVLCSRDDKRLVSSVSLKNGTIVTAKLLFGTSRQAGVNSDNSTDSSEGSPTGHLEGPNIEQEKTLPSVLMTSNSKNLQFLLSVCDFAIQYGLTSLRDSARTLLKLLPSGLDMVTEIQKVCRECAQMDLKDSSEVLGGRIIGSSPSKTLYTLEILHSMLMPALESENCEFQGHFILSGGLKLLMDIASSKDFMAAESGMRRCAIYCVMKMLKLLLTSSAYANIIQVSQQKQSSPEEQSRAVTLQNTVLTTAEYKTKSTATLLAKQHYQKLASVTPDLTLIMSLQSLARTCAVGGETSVSCDPDSVSEITFKSLTVDSEEINLSKESLEVLCLALTLAPRYVPTIMNGPDWRSFVTDVLLLTKNRMIRVTAADQLFYIVTKCNTDITLVEACISLLFSTIESVAKEHASTCGEYFRLLSKLLNYAYLNNIQISGVSNLLEVELKWLVAVRDETIVTHHCHVEGAVLDGHLSLIVELLSFHTVEERYILGSRSDGPKLIQTLVLDFLFPASQLIYKARANPELAQYDESLATPVCSTTECTMSAFRLINALCVGCVQNMHVLHDLLIELFYSGHEPALVEWEYLPHVGPRQSKGFVGLKNAGATCYMNAVLQQLYTIPYVRKSVLALNSPADDLLKEEEEWKRKVALARNPIQSSDNELSPSSSETNRKDTNRKVIMQVQSVFGHLLEGKLQYHVPEGFWRDFRLWGEQVNLREQYDAFEFFNCLVENLDEGLKAYGSQQLLSNALGGSFADQKICKECPHRYSREEQFTALNIDIRNKEHLFESLDAFVKGDLLEGANAYHCEKCDKKVNTVKRLCIKKLPKILVIQLKRFDYDWEREMSVKFNDYFEFPREFDMAPYTASRLAEIEGEAISDSSGTEKERAPEESTQSTKYVLRGIVVHSGQASGGHYYSFVHIRPSGSSAYKWYKFDDGEVTEAKIEDEEEFKAQCFGGEYTGEVYDHVLKKTHYRQQKRWWSAYLLFYDRVDFTAEDEETVQRTCNIPQPIKTAVQRQNLEFLHRRSHYSYPYFQFMKQLLLSNYNQVREQSSANTESHEELLMLCVKLVTTFLFHCGFRTKKSLRGPANEWFEALQPYLLYSAKIRRWFVENVFLHHTERFSEYLLESPSVEVRNVFAKLIPVLCHRTNADPTFEVEIVVKGKFAHSLFSELALNNLLQLLKKEVPDYSRHTPQYFQVFQTYASKGRAERQQLISLGVPSLFIATSLDEGPGPPLRSNYTDLTKLHSVVAQLVKCCDLSPLQRSAIEGKTPLPNPYQDYELIIPLPNDLYHWLFERNNSVNLQHGTTYVKRFMEDGNSLEEMVRFFGFCCWENWSFSVVTLSEILTEVQTVQTSEMKQYLNLLAHILMVQDTWQQYRILHSLRGTSIPHQTDGLMHIIQHGEGQSHYQRRAYLCIKFLVDLCNRLPQVQQMLYDDVQLIDAWHYALQWLQTEMEKRPYVNSTYNYSSWSSSAQSNEASNGYYLERSNSAKLTLKRARELFPLEESPEEASEDLPGPDNDISIEEISQVHIHGTGDMCKNDIAPGKGIVLTEHTDQPEDQDEPSSVQPCIN
ncbi:hypothetical protein EMCRGX_G025794 [Ephydatia muelleri]